MKFRAASLFFLCSGAVLLLFVFSLGDAGSAQAQAPRPTTPDNSPRTFGIRGSLRAAENNQPLEMVRVDLLRFTGETVATSFTRNNGDYEFFHLSTGEYYIEVKLEGYEPLREKVEIYNSSRVGVYLFLKSLSAVNLVAREPAISARELTIPRKATDAYNKGMEQLVLKSAPEASLRHFDKALEAFPEYYEAHHMRGVAYFQLGRLSEAEKEFRASVEQSAGKYAEPYFGLASLDTNNQKFADAMDLASKGLAIDKDSWRGHYEMARALKGLGRYQEAAKSIAEARQRKLDYPDIYLVSANLNMRLQNAEGLLKDLEEFLKLQPTGPQADQARQIMDSIRSRMAAAKVPAGTPPPKQEP